MEIILDKYYRYTFNTSYSSNTTMIIISRDSPNDYIYDYIDSSNNHIKSICSLIHIDA